MGQEEKNAEMELEYRVCHTSLHNNVIQLPVPLYKQDDFQKLMTETVMDLTHQKVTISDKNSNWRNKSALGHRST